MGASGTTSSPSFEGTSHPSATNGTQLKPMELYIEGLGFNTVNRLLLAKDHMVYSIKCFDKSTCTWGYTNQDI